MAKQPPERSTCFECLERWIRTDFSDDVAFLYGISDSPLPFGSAAVVEISANDHGKSTVSDEISGQFILVTLPASKEKISDKEEHTPFCIDSISKLIPIPYSLKGSSLTLRDLASKYLHDSTEDHVISSLILLTEGKSDQGHDRNFLNLLRFPSFMSTPNNTVRHPNICPILALVEKHNNYYILQPKSPFTLQNILHFSPQALQSDWQIRFFMYQILSALSYLHELGFPHGNLKPSTIHLTDSLWSMLSLTDTCLVKTNSNLTEICSNEDNNCPYKTILPKVKSEIPSEWNPSFKLWWRGEMGNFEYLLLLNKLAGRRWADPTFHTVMPWVIDFTSDPRTDLKVGWRDLTKSKWRLTKGDEQLDFTYESSEIPHHLSDECLSELAVCTYKARRLSLSTLRSAVRSVYEPKEYPSNMVRLYSWTPDECIPEFYTDPRIFKSVHSGMNDLAGLPWTGSTEEFVSVHRSALEGEYVSANLHHWIDLMFGYKLSGPASVEAKNVILPCADVARPRLTGRRQLFTKPHPGKLDKSNYLEDLEEANLFLDHERYLDPVYSYLESFDLSHTGTGTDFTVPISVSVPVLDFDLCSFLECFEGIDDSGSMGYCEILHWKQKFESFGSNFEELSNDIFSIGCVIAELYLKRPLFDPVSLKTYKESGILPGSMQELPPHVALIVESCVERDWTRRPSVKSLLDSKYFPQSVRSAHLFISPLQLVCGPGLRIKYAASLAKKGTLKAMGSFAAEMCAPYCLSLITKINLSDTETEFALSLLKEFLKCLTVPAAKQLVLPVIQKILQGSEYSQLKVSLLQDSFVRDFWSKLGKFTYLEKIHPLFISNLCNSPNKITASAALVVLIGSCEELGVPVTVHQTILPLIQYFGKGICAEGIDALVRIGALFGENFITKHIIPIIRNIIGLCIDSSQNFKTEPLQTWSIFALIDSLSTLNGLISVLPVKSVLREFVQDQTLLHIKVLMQIHLDLRVTQVAATTLTDLCRKIGPELTGTFVLPQLKDLFAELAFSQPPSVKNSKQFKLKLSKEFKIESRIDLVFILYPFFSQFIGIEKLRQSCSTWFLLEQALFKSYNWKWDSYGEISRSSSSSSSSETNTANTATLRDQIANYETSEYSPAKLLLNGSGWSKPQPQGVSIRSRVTAATATSANQGEKSDQSPAASISVQNQPWFWLPGPESNSDSNSNNNNDNSNSNNFSDWKIKCTVLCSARAHPGAVRAVTAWPDECTVFTAGVGPAFRGCVQRWDLARMSCISGYYGHDEVVNSICTISNTGRIASCDGTIHVWNGQTGKLITAYTESNTNLQTKTLISKVNTEQGNLLAPSGILSGEFSGNLYTCLHYLEFSGTLIAGTGNGSIRFIDIEREQKLHSWKSGSAEHSFSSLVSAVCSCGPHMSETHSSCIAVGLSSGNCRLLDSRSGNIVALWQNHDGYITKLAAVDDHLLVSSSLDRTLRVWDLRRNLASQSTVYRGHTDGISGFAVWGQDVISLSRNKIALSSLSRSATDQLIPQYLYSADRGTKNISALSSISVLPFSRLFLVGTEDGFLKICS